MAFFKAPFAGGEEKSRQLSKDYAAVAQAAGAEFLDAGSVIRTDGVDGLHLSAAAEQALGRAVAEKVKTILSEAGGPRSRPPEECRVGGEAARSPRHGRR